MHNNETRMFYFDTETDLIRQGSQFPELACLQYAYDRSSARLADRFEAFEVFAAALADPHATLVAHNAAFDFGVMAANYPELLPSIWSAYQDGRIICTMAVEQLLNLAKGEFKFRKSPSGATVRVSYALASLAFERAGMQLEKKLVMPDGTEQASWRLKYGLLRHRPIAEWPQGAVTYALQDVDALRLVFQSQRAEGVRLGYWPIAQACAQSRYAFWRSLTQAHGARTDSHKVEPLRAWAERASHELESELLEVGLLERNKKGELTRKMNAAKDRMRAAFADRSGEMPRTEPSATHPEGQPQVSEEACEESGDPALIRFAEYTKLGKLLSTDLPMLESGAEGPIHPSFGMAETGRATCKAPNLQNLRRDVYKTDVGDFGVRECFVPRPGYVFLQADYEQLELFTLAKVCLKLFPGEPCALAEMLNDGRDPHTELAAKLLGISAEEAYRRRKSKDGDKEFDLARQVAKVGNFGLPGALSDNSFVEYAWNLYRLEIDVIMARKVRSYWHELLPEMARYHAHIRGLVDEENLIDVVQVGSGRKRGRLRYTQACNSFFQGLGADVAHEAGWAIASACYVDRMSALYGCRIAFFVHDEFVLEVPESDPDTLTARGDELVRLMTESPAVRGLMLGMNLRTEPCAMRFLSKSAKTLRDEKGRLIPWPLK